MKWSILMGCCLLPASLSAQSTFSAPLMGWASWNNFYENISESIIKGQADALVSSGLSTAGYKYVNIDDGYFKNRNTDGSLGVDGSKFPNGMKVVADYIHSKGLKAGIYTDAGSNTCSNIFGTDAYGASAGIYNHDQQDANLFFKTWGYDFLKVDYCGGRAQGLDEKTRYTAIKNAILNTGRTDIKYNVCRWQFPGTWVTTLADSWRIADDINNTWGAVTRIIDANLYLAPYCSKGHYNDMDMLEVGRGMSAEEDKSHFSIWSIMSSPLMLGNNLKTISQQTKTIVGNTEVIAVNQDTTGLQAHIVTDNGAGLQVLAKNLHGKQSLERAVVLFNRTGATASMSVKWKDLNLQGAASVRDLWAHSDLGMKDSMYTATVPSHGVVMLKVTGTKTKLQETFEGEYAWINNFNLTQNINIVANQGRATVDANCSGRAKASYLGNRADNYIEFREVYANAAGKYNLTITYLSGENRSATVSINGKDSLLSNLNSGSFSTLKNLTFSIVLHKGYNTIRFSNATGNIPDIDKIHIDLNKSVANINLSIVSPTNNSSFVSGSPINLEATATTTLGTIANVKFYEGATLLASDDNSPYTQSWTNATVGSHTLKVVATDNAGNTDEAIITVKVNAPQGPFNGIVHAIPGILQMEEYDVGGNGNAYLDNTAGTETDVTFRNDEDVDLENCTDAGGGYNLGYATAGEWVEFTSNVAKAGLYQIDLRIACNGDGRTLQLSSDNTPISGTINIPNTGGWQTWQTVSVSNVQLKAGQQVLRLTIGSSDFVNVNFVEIREQVSTGLGSWEAAGFQLCPNPFQEEGFQLKNIGEFAYRITEMNGSLREEGAVNESRWIGQELKPGVYFVTIEHEKGVFVQKIMRH